MPAKTKAKPKGRNKRQAKAEAPEIFCMKCKTKTASKDVTPVTMKNGRAAVNALCVVCGTQKFRIGVLT